MDASLRRAEWEESESAKTRRYGGRKKIFSFLAPKIERRRGAGTSVGCSAGCTDYGPAGRRVRKPMWREKGERKTRRTLSSGAVLVMSG